VILFRGDEVAAFHSAVLRKLYGGRHEHSKGNSHTLENTNGYVRWPLKWLAELVRSAKPW